MIALNKWMDNSRCQLKPSIMPLGQMEIPSDALGQLRGHIEVNEFINLADYALTGYEYPPLSLAHFRDSERSQPAELVAWHTTTIVNSLYPFNLGRMEDLLALAAQIERANGGGFEWPIIALDSPVVIDGLSFAPVLHERKIDLLYYTANWQECCYFLLRC